MEQLHRLEFSKQRKLKASMLMQERCLAMIFLIFIVAFLIVCLSMIIPGVVRISYNPSLNALFIIGFIAMLGAWRRWIDRQKKRWMQQYGQQITAVVTEVKANLRPPVIHLEWCNPHTGKTHRYRIIVPQSERSSTVSGGQLSMRSLAAPLTVVPVARGFAQLVIGITQLAGRKRFESDLACQYERGVECPVWIDPSDPGFYCSDW
jgi:hypothetical protein